MQDVDWNLALARLNFLHEYIRQMRKEVNMKNEKLAARAGQPQPLEPEARQAPARELMRPWPARRRFWHRAFHRPAQPTAPRRPQTPEPTK
jgi:hypothetical protein